MPRRRDETQRQQLLQHLRHAAQLRHTAAPAVCGGPWNGRRMVGEWLDQPTTNQPWLENYGWTNGRRMIGEWLEKDFWLEIEPTSHWWSMELL